MTTAQVAELLDCTQQTVEEKARLGILPSVKFGRSHMFPSEALLSQLNELAKENLRPRTKQPKQNANETVANETTAANDFVIATGSKSVSIGKVRKPKTFEFGSTRKQKAA